MTIKELNKKADEWVDKAFPRSEWSDVERKTAICGFLAGYRSKEEE